MSGAPDGGGGPARSPVPPLWAVVAGRLFLAGLKTPVALLLVWLAALLPAVGHRELSDLIAAVIASALLGECAGALAVRPAQLRAGHSAPGGWAYALPDLLVPPAVAVAVGWLMLGGAPAGLALGAAWAVPAAAEALLGRPWERGPSRAEFAERSDRFKEMTRETFAPEIERARPEARRRLRRRWEREERRRRGER